MKCLGILTSRTWICLSNGSFLDLQLLLSNLKFLKFFTKFLGNHHWGWKLLELICACDDSLGVQINERDRQTRLSVDVGGDLRLVIFDIEKPSRGSTGSRSTDDISLFINLDPTGVALNVAFDHIEPRWIHCNYFILKNKAWTPIHFLLPNEILRPDPIKARKIAGIVIYLFKSLLVSRAKYPLFSIRRRHCDAFAHMPDLNGFVIAIDRFFADDIVILDYRPKFGIGTALFDFAIS